jgi:hypothetical protein
MFVNFSNLQTCNRTAVNLRQSFVNFTIFEERKVRMELAGMVHMLVQFRILVDRDRKSDGMLVAMLQVCFLNVQKIPV